MTDQPDIEFFFDIASPYSYMAATQIDDLEADTGCSVRWRPFLLGGVFKETGNSAPARIPEKATYMLADLHRWADRYDVPFEMPSSFPINSLVAQRALVAAQAIADDAVPRFARRLFRAYWVDNTDISEADAVAEAADDVDLPGEKLIAMTDQPDVKDRLRGNSDEAVDRGAFGAPTFFVGDEMFWGNDRLEFVREAAKRAADE